MQIYLDNNATTRIDNRVVAAMADCWNKGYVNPASQHRLGQQARATLETAREGIATLLGARTAGMGSDQIVLTSGGTEANNLAILGLAGQPPGRIIISSIEHPSVVAAAERAQRMGFQVERLPATRTGEVQFEVLPDFLADGHTKLVSVMLANNETGVIQDIREIAKLCAAARVPMHTDAVQMAGKLPVDFAELGVDALTVAAHKFHGPIGIGALILRHGIKLEPIHFGGFQQAGLRPGTESVALAVGMHEALRLWQFEEPARSQKITDLRDLFERELTHELSDLVVHGHAARRLPNTSNISFLGIDRQSLLLALDMADIACSTGSACASGSSEPSPVLTAMGLSAAEIQSALRFSLSAQTEVVEIAEAVRRIVQICRRLRQHSESRKSFVPAPQTS